MTIDRCDFTPEQRAEIRAGQRTSIRCSHCKRANFRVVPGGETRLMLRCHWCGQYIYFVGGILCMLWGDCPCPRDLEAVRKALDGGMLLKYEWVKKIREFEHRLWGLENKRPPSRRMSVTTTRRAPDAKRCICCGANSEWFGQLRKGCRHPFCSICVGRAHHQGPCPKCHEGEGKKGDT
jgi:hypothetical protein